MIKRVMLAAAVLATGIGVVAGATDVVDLTSGIPRSFGAGPVPRPIVSAEPTPNPDDVDTGTRLGELLAPLIRELDEPATTEMPLAEATAVAPPEPQVPTETAAPTEPGPRTTTELPPAAPAPAAPAPTGNGAQGAFDQRMVALINAERAAAGVAPLSYWDGLRTGALNHSGWMDRNDFQHASDITIDGDAAAAGCGGGWAENIYWTSDTTASPEAAMDAYMNSPGHRANILHPDLRFVATGTMATDGGLFNTQRFSFVCG